jgi:hypothetical protein
MAVAVAVAGETAVAQAAQAVEAQARTTILPDRQVLLTPEAAEAGGGRLGLTTAAAES